ncbi:uncharacterized protein LOC113238831 [Hyposmocoma kahamanoa]|uniref:uncharacterized protein LOC113238831 n=1 Tax=Hyposmocoma kahamanoa TaxID=1477025 RepID=UPI000E6D7CBB|nr:uncharacterized protein LOC113238831 [Hyposmocoma kahamanoa]
MGVFVTEFFKNQTDPGNEWYKYNKDGGTTGKYPHWKKAHFCMYPDMYSIIPDDPTVTKPFNVTGNGIFVPHVKHNYFHWQSVFMIVSFQIFMILAGVTINLLMHPVCEIVRNSLNIETMMKNARIQQQMLEKKDE